MKTTQDKKTYTVGFVRGVVLGVNAEGVTEHAARGDVVKKLDVNKAAIFQATNRGKILGDSSQKTADIAERVKEFEAEVAAEDKELKAFADAQIEAGANMAAQVKNLQAELAELRKRVA